MLRVLIALPLLLLALPAAAQDRSKHLEHVLDCRKVADSTERLACYDKSVADLDTAERQKDVMIVDKEQVREARRSVFGLKLPNIRLFGGGDKDELEEVESTVKSISYQSDGHVFFVIADGARWVQTDDRAVVGVKAGGAVTIRKGALGSFFAKFKGAVAVRVARVN